MEEREEKETRDRKRSKSVLSIHNGRRKGGDGRKRGRRKRVVREVVEWRQSFEENKYYIERWEKELLV